jgi:peptide/nickel transport system substrate-binding protein
MVNGKERSTISPEVYEKNPMGTGPFKFVEWKKGQYLKLVRNENYFKGVPKIKELTFYPITDENTRISALKAGKVDIAIDVNPSLAAALKGAPGIEITSIPSARCELTWLNTSTPPFNDKRVRLALNYAVNKEELIATVVEKFGLPTGQACAPYFFGYNPNIKPYPYNPEKAKKLLSEAGYPNGLDVVLDAGTTFEELARAIAGYLDAVGIRCKMQIREFGASYTDFLERKLQHMWHASWGNWSLLDIGGTIKDVYGCTKPDIGQGRWSYYCNPRIEELISELNTTDEKKRLRVAREANKILHEDAAALFLYFRMDIHAKKTGIPEFKARRDNTVRFDWVKGD